MQKTNAQEEKRRLIAYKPGTTFTITCNFRGRNVLCAEHAGPERCVNGKPWSLFTDLFPVINGRLGQSLTYGLTQTNVYCKRS